MQVKFIVLGFFLMTGCSRVQPNDAPQGQMLYKDVDISEAHGLATAVQHGVALRILDVRTPKEYDSGHLEGAYNLNFLDPDFKEELMKLDKDRPYLVHCRSGGRSSRAVKLMKELGFKKIYHLKGGIRAWKREKLPIVK